MEASVCRFCFHFYSILFRLSCFPQLVSVSFLGICTFWGGVLVLVVSRGP